MKIMVRPESLEVLPWRSNSRGNRGDRMLREVTASIPAFIADLEVPPLGELELPVQSAIAAVARFDSACDRLGIGISPLMVRTESLASSRFEQLDATEVNFLRATIGQNVSADAIQMAAGYEALRQVVESSGSGRALLLADFLDAHKTLLKHDSLDSNYAGKVRDFQNWIEGNAKSPIGATYIPPAPERVQPLLDDLFVFANRTDINPIVLAAIAHAQFEAIHPFADGNGRIGRALITGILRKFDLSRAAVVPLAAAFMGDRNAYLLGLREYSKGDAGPMVAVLAKGLKVASEAGLNIVPQLADLPSEWMKNASQRSDSSLSRVMNMMLNRNTITAGQVADELAVTQKTANSAIDLLEQINVLQEITGRKRDRYWVAPDVIDLLGYYSDDITQRMRELS